MKKAAFVLLAALIPAAPVFAGDERLYFKSERTQNTLVELYTSDLNAGCNAALEWMSSQEKNPPAGLWKKFVPLAMHVSYWDVPGGRDGFAKKTFDDFLLSYKKLWKVSRVYAPTVVVNGTEWGGWSHGQDIPQAPPNDVGVLSADGRKREDHFLVEFIPSKKIEADGLTVHAALLGFGLASKPSEGENRGTALKHDFIVLSYMEQSFRLSYGVLTTDLEISVKKALRAKKYAVVFWVTPGQDMRPIQATGGYLPS